MSLQELKAKNDRIIDHWLAEMEKRTLDELLAKPAPESWSMGQVMIHLWMASKGFFFKNAEMCLTGTETRTDVRPNWQGYVLLALNMMPPTRIKMPGKVAVQPNPPESKEQLRKRMEEVRSLVHSYIDRMPQSNPALRTRHPFLGWLNCTQWIRLNEIHFRHHLRQKERIAAHFGWK